MKSLFATVLLAATVSPAYTAARHTPLLSHAAHVQRMDSISSGKAADTTPLPKYPVIGVAAPQLHLDHLLNAEKEAPIKFNDGHPYVLDFTAMWCGSCPLTYPIMDEIRKQYAAQGVRTIFVTTIYGLAEDHVSQIEIKDELAALPKYFAKHNVTNPIVVYDKYKDVLKGYADGDPDSDGLRNMGLPKMVFIDGKGIVRQVISGADSTTRARALAAVAALVAPATHDKH